MALQSVPFVGAPLVTFLATHGQRLAEERLLMLIGELRSSAERLGEEKLSRDFFESEEGIGLFARVLRAAAEERDRAKLRAYAAVLLGAGNVDRPFGGIEPDAVLSALVELSAHEVGLLRRIATATAGGAAWPPRDLDIDEGPDHLFHLKRIERTGLIAEVPTFDRTEQSGRYEPTPTLGRLFDLLRAGGFESGGAESDPDLVAPAGGCVFCGEPVAVHLPLSTPTLSIERDGQQIPVEMPSLVEVCQLCATRAAAGDRRPAACIACRRWGPEGSICPTCGDALLSVRY
jgi:hypothetical protein